MLIARAHGWDRNLSNNDKAALRKKYKIKKFFNSYTFYNLAFNVRPTEICGKLGNLQINRLNKEIKTREKNFKVFLNSAKKNKELLYPRLSHMSLISNFAFPVVCKSKKYFQLLTKTFKKYNIEIRPIISGNILKQPFIKQYLNQTSKMLKNSNYLHEKAFYFPNNPDLNDEEIKRICFILENV